MISIILESLNLNNHLTEKKLTIKRLLLTRSQKPLIKLEIYLKITICVNVELMVPTWRLTISLAITKRRITNKKIYGC